jgi:hypothetical protein
MLDLVPVVARGNHPCGNRAAIATITADSRGAFTILVGE